MSDNVLRYYNVKQVACFNGYPHEGEISITPPEISMRCVHCDEERFELMGMV
jgi:hypothetical protein